MRADNIFSCEFFPPRTDAGMDKLLAVRNQLDESMQPAFYSVTFGAGGTNRDRTLHAVDRLGEGNAAVAPHSSCIGSNRPFTRRAHLMRLLPISTRSSIRPASA